MKSTPFFILSCARSGSTSLARILNEAHNGICLVEPDPKLNRESRLLWEGRLPNPEKLIESAIIPRIEAAQLRNLIYGEKNLTLTPFISCLYKRLNCRFVFLIRDGREVVRSLMDWHHLMFGNIYREALPSARLRPGVLQILGANPVHLDDADFSRPRPLRGTAAYDNWEHFTREEMCAWYWSVVNERIRAELLSLPAEAWYQVDYSSISEDKILETAGFLELEGLDRRRIRHMLDQRINSVSERAGIKTSYPAFPSWSRDAQNTFQTIAGSTMRSFGYEQLRLSERKGVTVPC